MAPGSLTVRVVSETQTVRQRALQSPAVKTGPEMLAPFYTSRRD